MAKFTGFLPADAVAVSGHNTTDITNTTAQEILATPSDTNQAYYITSIVYMNRTVGEQPFIQIQDEQATPIVYDVCDLDAPENTRQHTFWPPLKIATGQAVNGVATTAVGDTEVCINGFLGTP